MKKIKLGIIGASSFAEAHLYGINRIQNAEVVAICDIERERAEKLAKENEIPEIYTDYKELLKNKDIDAVTVPLPDQLHCQVTVEALHAGKHVLCEKPMALSLDDCKKMIEASRKSGKQLMIGQVSRYTPSFKLAKQLVSEGEIGELFFVESEYAHDYSKLGGIGGWRIAPERHPVVGGGCHAVDLLRWIAGNPTSAFAYANNKVLTDWPIMDFTIGLLKFPDNVVGKVMTSIGCKRSYTMRTVLYGTKGTIIVDNTSNNLLLFKEELYGQEKFRDFDQQRLPLQIPVAINNHNTADEISDFCSSLLEDRLVVTDGVEGASTVAACLAIVESARDGEEKQIVYDF